MLKLISSLLVICNRELSQNAEFMETNHNWSVEGDFGFMGSFETKAQANDYIAFENQHGCLHGLNLEISVNE